MPGPCNAKKKRKSLAKKEKNTPRAQPLDVHHLDAALLASQIHPSLNSAAECSETPLQTPYIYDPGNGPRVKDIRAFLESYFAQPALLSDPLCAEFAQEEVLQMLSTVLPEEIALVLWYNKSRGTSRICPACLRLYRIGDALQNHLDDRHKRGAEVLPQLQREQEISGLCSPVCFILASFDYPASITSTWGQMADEMSSNAWDLLNGPGQGQGDTGLGMLLKMTRLGDLGLGQLCFPDML